MRKPWEVPEYKPMGGRMLTTLDVAERLNVNTSTVRRWRLDEVGPRFVKIGSMYRYPSDDLEEFIAERLRTSVKS